MPKSLLFVGSCNRALPYFETANGSGIAAYVIDDATGETIPAGLTEGIDNPTFLAVSPDHTVLCATSEVIGWNEGTVTAYAIDRTSGRLTYINKQPTRGDIAAHLSFDATGRFVAVANYAVLPVSEKPNCAVVIYRLAADGSIGAPTGMATHAGKGVDPSRQERPHAHCVRWTPDNRFILVADLGTDSMVVYSFDAGDGSIARHGALALPEGSGPRHFAFHPSAPFVYVVNELGASVASLRLDAANGTLELIGVDRTTPPDVSGLTHCSAIKVAADGRHLLVGNRGHDSIARFAIDGLTGMATLAETSPSGGRTPRDLAFGAGGALVAVANQDSDRISLFRYHAQSGDLVPFGSPLAAGTPTAVAFVDMR